MVFGVVATSRLVIVEDFLRFEAVAGRATLLPILARVAARRVRRGLTARLTTLLRGDFAEFISLFLPLGGQSHSQLKQTLATVSRRGNVNFTVCEKRVSG